MQPYVIPQLLIEKQVAWPPTVMSISTALFPQILDKEFDLKVGLSHSPSEPHGIHHFGNWK